MKLFNALTAILIICVGLASTRSAGAANRLRAAEQVKSAVAQTIAGINAHDPVKATAFEADNVIFIQPGEANQIGRATDRAGFKTGFAHDPGWKVRLIEEHVDVAASGDLATYRSIYYEDSVKKGVPMTHKVNFIAEFRRQPDGSWKMPWYVVSPLEQSHKR